MERAPVLIQPERNVIAALPEEPLVVDVGACIGDFIEAVLDARPRASIIAVEPQRVAAQQLRDRYDGRVEVVEAALGAQRERRTLYSDGPSSYLATFHPRHNYEPIKSLPAGEVEVWPLASLPEVGDRQVDLVKIDTEGHELAVIEGTAPILDRISGLLFEHFLLESGDPAAYTSHTIEDFKVALPGFCVENLTYSDGVLSHMWLAKPNKEEQ